MIPRNGRWAQRRTRGRIPILSRDRSSGPEGTKGSRKPLTSEIDAVTKSGYDRCAKVSELRRWLRKQGCTFVEEYRHTRITLGTKVTRMPRQPAKEIKSGTLRAILKDLDLKM